MVKVNVEKPVAACLLDAVKLVLGQLAAFRMQMEQQGGRGPDGLPETYIAVRRLRDHLQRLVAAFPHDVTLDLGAGDADLLVSVACRAVELLETEIATSEPGAGAASRGLAKESIRILLDRVPGFASRPVFLLPGQPDGAASRARRTLQDAVMRKLRADTTSAVESGALRGLAAEPTQTGIDPMAPGLDALELSSGQSGGFGMGRTAMGPGQGVPAGGGGGPGMFPGSAAEQDPGDRPGERGPWGASASQGAPARGPEGGAGMARPGSAERTVTPAAPSVAEPGAAGSFMDPRLVRDPRLRSLVAMDVKARERAASAGDFRMEAVVLRSLLVGVAWDAALQRRRDLDLQGPPDSWDLQDVVAALLGGELGSSDAMQLASLDRCQELMHPPAQLVRPQVITRAAVEAFRALTSDLCQRLLSAAG